MAELNSSPPHQNLNTFHPYEGEHKYLLETNYEIIWNKLWLLNILYLALPCKHLNTMAQSWAQVPWTSPWQLWKCFLPSGWVKLVHRHTSTSRGHCESHTAGLQGEFVPAIPGQHRGVMGWVQQGDVLGWGRVGGVQSCGRGMDHTPVPGQSGVTQGYFVLYDFFRWCRSKYPHWGCCSTT